MKRSNRFSRRRAPRTDAARRAQLLAAFDRSGWSVAAFTRRHGLHYTTFYRWHRDRADGKASPGFVQVELPEPAAPLELVIELGGTARLRLTAERQIPLAARLLQTLHPSRPC